MTIYQLECFIAVAEELNFSAAAERLFTTQPAITYQINALEKETGLHLFERTTRRTKLTAAGQSFYLDMVQMTSFGRQALKKAQDIQEADRSRLTVGLRQLFDYGTFSSILAEFQHQFPNACVDVVPQDNRRPLEQLRSGQLDIGFFYATEHSRDRDISFTPLFSLGYHVLMNPNSPLADPAGAASGRPERTERGILRRVRQLSVRLSGTLAGAAGAGGGGLQQDLSQL